MLIRNEYKLKVFCLYTVFLLIEWRLLIFQLSGWILSQISVIRSSRISEFWTQSLDIQSELDPVKSFNPAQP